jgi:regulatory protein YycI of two-component signal transduction system YycFG
MNDTERKIFFYGCLSIIFVTVFLLLTLFFYSIYLDCQHFTIENSHSRQESIEDEQTTLIDSYYDSKTVEQKKFAVERLEDMCFEYGKNKMLRQSQVILSNEGALCR